MTKSPPGVTVYRQRTAFTQREVRPGRRRPTSAVNSASVSAAATSPRTVSAAVGCAGGAHLVVGDAGHRLVDVHLSTETLGGLQLRGDAALGAHETCSRLVVGALVAVERELREPLGHLRRVNHLVLDAMGAGA